jgi:hypothetical protein
MQTPNVVRAIAALAPGKSVTVTTPAGITHELPLQTEPQPSAADPLQAMSEQLLGRDAETRATVAAVAARADETLNAVKSALVEVAAGHSEIAQSVSKLEGTLHMPVKPVYDRDGKLLYAQRVKKPGA